MTATITSDETVTTATLLRGRVYVYKGLTFERGLPVVVTDDLAADLADMYDEVRDSDNEIIEKPLFNVLYDAPKPVPVEVGQPRRRRVQPANVRSAPVEVEDDAPRGRIRRPRGSIAAR